MFSEKWRPGSEGLGCDETKSVPCATGNGASHAATAVANTSGFLQMGFWRLKGGCGEPLKTSD